MRKIIVASAGSIVLLLGAAQLCASTIAIDPPVISSNYEPLVSERQSTLMVSISTPLSAMQAAGDRLIPDSLNGVINDPTNLMTEDTIKWTAQLGNLSVSNREGKIGVSVPFTGTATLHGRVGAKRKNKGLLGKLEEIAGFTFSETPSFAGTITGTVSPSLNPDWSVNAGIDARVALSKAETQIFGKAIKISFRGDVQKVVNQKVAQIVRELNDHLATDASVREEIKRIWTSLHLSETLVSNPPIQFGLIPVSLGAVAPHVSDGALHLNVGARFTSRLALVGDELAAGVSPLPKNNSSLPNAGIALSVPVYVKLADLDSVPLSNLGLPTTIETVGGELDIKSMSVAGDNGQLIINADVAIRPKLLGEITTTVYLIGRPVLNSATQEISVDDIRYDVSTEGVLAKVADFVLRPLVLSELRKRAVFRFADNEKKLLDTANAELEKLSAVFPQGVLTQLSLSEGQVSSLTVDDGWLMAIVDAKGNASLVIDNFNLFD